MEAFSLFEVNQYIRRVIAANFDEPIWVECEINQVSFSRGHAYLELIEKETDSEQILAKNSATIWFKQLNFINKKLGKIADAILTEGVKVKLKVQIEYKERFGLSLNILDIDPSFTIGHYEMQRQQVLDRLRMENLLDENSILDLPTVIKKIAVISSETAAGYQDFLNHLNNNSYGYTFETELFKAAMQGQKTEKEVVQALSNASKQNFDIITIIRGGGSKLDLSAFDNYKIAVAIAQSRVPVFTGIGHDIDMTVADIVSHSVLKTPTAVADYIIEHNLDFESRIQSLYQSVASMAIQKLHLATQSLSYLENILVSLPSAQIKVKRQQIDNLLNAAFLSAAKQIQIAGNALDNKSEIIALLKPQNVLKKGFALVKSDHKYIAKRNEINPSLKSLDIEFYDGEIKVKIEKNES